MRTIAIATLPALFLLVPAFASTTDDARQTRSSLASKAAPDYTYINRLTTPTGDHTQRTITAAQNLSQQL
ncbi:hypothetical protein ED28_06065 [[Pantoea] beijingensis]|uniref:Uncharacterized protein n=1 Tax=[Pantoea] beijingensis TaxID=1324864 RepID=A0A443IFM4_9GAMM|nr:MULTISPECIES: hypothetical protein [Erwiniaceae]RWR02884.1 hypothetical protein ED28_06065 [[Pantoea] beijingensis]